MNSTAPEVKVLNMIYLKYSIEQETFNIEVVLQLMANHWSESKTYKVSLDQFIGLQEDRKHLLAEGWRTCPIQILESPHTRTPACLSTSGWFAILLSAKAIWAQLHGVHTNDLEFVLDDISKRWLLKFSWNQEANVQKQQKISDPVGDK